MSNRLKWALLVALLALPPLLFVLPDILRPPSANNGAGGYGFAAALLFLAVEAVVFLAGGLVYVVARVVRARR